MDQVEVEVVNAPVLELLLGDGFDLFVVVECLPELGDNKEVFTLYETFLDGAGNTLTGFDFIAIIWKRLSAVISWLF
jgi:hypothetical protein